MRMSSKHKRMQVPASSSTNHHRLGREGFFPGTKMISPDRGARESWEIIFQGWYNVHEISLSISRIGCRRAFQLWFRFEKQSNNCTFLDFQKKKLFFTVFFFRKLNSFHYQLGSHIFSVSSMHIFYSIEVSILLY